VLVAVRCCPPAQDADEQDVSQPGDYYLGSGARLGKFGREHPERLGQFAPLG